MLERWLAQLLANDRDSINTDWLAYLKHFLLPLETNLEWAGLKSIN